MAAKDAPGICKVMNHPLSFFMMFALKAFTLFLLTFLILKDQWGYNAIRKEGITYNSLMRKRSNQGFPAEQIIILLHNGTKKNWQGKIFYHA